MNKNYTLKELADIGGLESAKHSNHQKAREAFTKAILDAIGYEFPKDEEREAFERWLAEQGDGFHPCGDVDKAFAVWKAGREELRRAQLLDKQPAEPAWIPWEGGECPLADGMIWEAKLRSGTHVKAKGLACRWDHNGRAGDIVAYRVLEG